MDLGITTANQLKQRKYFNADTRLWWLRLAFIANTSNTISMLHLRYKDVSLKTKFY